MTLLYFCERKVIFESVWKAERFYKLSFCIARYYLGRTSVFWFWPKKQNKTVLNWILLRRTFRLCSSHQFHLVFILIYLDWFGLSLGMILIKTNLRLCRDSQTLLYTGRHKKSWNMVCIFGDFPAIQRSRLYFGEERENHFFRLISTFSIDSQPVLLAYLILLCDSIYCLTTSFVE